MTLRACSECRRHFAAEPACPFCGAMAPPLPPTEHALARGRLSRAAAFASGLLAGCYTSSPPPQEPARGAGVEQRQHIEEEQGQRFATPPDTAANSTIEGVITDPSTGAPQPNQVVYLQTRTQAMSGGVASALTTQSDANGHYAFTHLAPGEYVLTYGRPQPRVSPIQRTVTLADNDRQQVDVAVPVYVPTNIPMPYGAPPARARIV